MKIQVPTGVDQIEIDVPEGATAQAVLQNADVITVCGEQGAVRLNGTEVPLDTPIKEGDTVEPVSKANEKACGATGNNPQPTGGGGVTKAIVRLGGDIIIVAEHGATVIVEGEVDVQVKGAGKVNVRTA